MSAKGTRRGAPAGAGRPSGAMMEQLVESAHRIKLADTPNLPPAVLAAKRPPGSRGTTVNVATNVYGLLTPKNTPVFRYDFRVEAIFSSNAGADRRKELTKQTRDDYTSIDRKTNCARIFRTLLARESAFFGKKATIYDRGAILYTIDKLPLAEKEVKCFTLARTDVPELTLDDKCIGLEVRVKQCDETFELILDDFQSAINQNLANVDRSLAQFLEILTSQEAFFSDGVHVAYGTGQSYLLNHYDFGFTDADTRALPDGKYMGIGASKSVRMIEGPGGPGNVNAALAIDTKKAAFHVENQTVAEKIAAIVNAPVNKTTTLTPFQLGQVHRQLKGLVVQCTYGNSNRRFAIAGLSKRAASQESFKLANGQTVTVAAYVEQTYNVKLQFPHLQCLQERRPAQGGFSLYPPELCVVCENQRVTQAQQTPAQVKEMITACATLPANRQRQNETQMKALKLDQQARNNAHLAAVGVRTTNALNCQARQLPAPQLEYRGARKVPANKDSGLWRSDREQYLLPATVGKWAMYGLVMQNDRFGDRDLTAFAERFTQACRGKGMQLGAPEEVRCIVGTPQGLETLMKTAQTRGLQFVFFVQSTNLKLHKLMKMLEVQLQVVTQDATTMVINNVLMKGQAQTVENIVNKTNLKLGGLNFAIHLEQDKLTQQWIAAGNRMFIGMDVSHPPPLTPAEQARGATPRIPSVVGFAANMKKNPAEFVGDFRYQQPRKEEGWEIQVVTVMKEIVISMLQQFRANRGALPEHIFLFRDGISEGQYRFVIQLETPAIRDAAIAVGGVGYKPKVTVIVAQKNHNIEGVKAPEQNIKCGTVVDKFIVSPVCTEFYLNAHRALQGTAKTPRFSVLVDDAALSQDELQGITYALCYGMQIVTLSTSLPAPVMIADRYAKRGLNNFVARFGDDSLETTASGDDGSGGFNYAHLNAELSNVGKPLANCRVNA